MIVAALFFFAVGLFNGGEYFRVSIPTLPYWTRFVAVGTSVGIFALAFILPIGKNGGSSPPQPPPSSKAAPSSPTPSTALPSPKPVRIEHPFHTASFTGVNVHGVATGLKPGEHLWLLDEDPTDSRLYQDNEQPLSVAADGAWSFQEQQVGDHVGQQIRILLIRADDACNNIFKKAKPDPKDNTVSFPSLPAGCVIADAVRVTITK
jgi:hypothetical protein